jgi:aspartate-semialdehyde dehydrogenase
MVAMQYVCTSLKITNKMTLAVVGATGLVGQEVLRVLEERQVEFDELHLVASAKSVGQKIKFKGKEYSIKSMEETVALAPDIAIFSAGGGHFSGVGAKVCRKGYNRNR